ncbi:MAG: MFS transporter [Planctomycetes bacterium]|nr:MFS transporter [Planctomycetota bacterium]
MADPVKVARLETTLKGASAAWILYDVANTVYAAVLTYIFTPFAGEKFGTRGAIGLVSGAAMVLSAFSLDVFANLADRTGRARIYLVLSTLICIGGLACFGATDSQFVTMAAFFTATLCYNTALVFYNSLLPSVADDRHQGLVSGLGVGLGYIGTLIIVLLLDLPGKYGYGMTFAIAAGIFLLLAMPCFLFVRERRVLERQPVTWPLIRAQMGTLLRTIKGLPQDRAMMWFLLGNFFCVDVLNTAILYFGDFTVSTFFKNTGSADHPVWQSRMPLEAFGLHIETASGILKLAGTSLNVLALIFGVLLGFTCDRFGALKVLRLSALFLVLGLLGTAAFAGVDLGFYLLMICGFGGLGLAGIWTAGRKLLIELAPRERLAQYFSLYGLTTKVSIIGSAVFGTIVDQVTRATGNDLAAWKAALYFQAVPLTLGLCFLMLVRKPKVITDELSTT